MRHPPPLARKSVVLAPQTRPELLDLELSVVTPLFGGGIEPGQVDDVLPVRASSIRGHLRFWWRACRGHTYPSAARLFADESAIWGKTHTGNGSGGPSDIEVEVTILKAGRPLQCVTYEPVTRPNGHVRWRPHWGPYPAYALFPFQGEAEDDHEPSTWGKPPREALSGVRFRLRLTAAPHVAAQRVADLREAAEAAVWAWVTFGGVGARTRRGCGSLYCADQRFSPGQADPGDWISDAVDRHAPGETNPTCPRLPFLAGGRLLLQRRANGPLPDLVAWGAAVNLMRDFRQRPDYGRDPGPGLSRWPEADSLRNLTRASPGHAPSDADLKYFPRAELGLPIVFHFKDAGDPPDYSLEVDKYQASRMASPIILKPLAVSPERGYPMALLLDAPFIADLAGEGHPFPLRLRPREHTEEFPVANPADVFDPTKAAHVTPLTRAGATNARAAFVGFVRQEWNGQMQEVEL